MLHTSIPSFIRIVLATQLVALGSCIIPGTPVDESDDASAAPDTDATTDPTPGSGGTSIDSSGDGGSDGSGTSSDGSSGEDPMTSDPDTTGGGMETTGDETGVEPPSCASLDDAACNGENCCTVLDVGVGETVELTVNGPDATLSPFSLDKYEVTVGRFREFVSNYDAWRASNPQAGAAESPNAPGTGWQADPLWEGDLAASEAVLRQAVQCSDFYETWTEDSGDNESLPVNCVNWYEAFAFCAWDGGRLPTEVEWAYSAIGGGQGRAYPWGNTAPTADFAVYGCRGSGTSTCTFDDILDVGSKPNGDGRWGHSDLGGSMHEWVFDWSAAFPEEVEMDFVNLDDALYRGTRSGDWRSSGQNLEANRRTNYRPEDRTSELGFRCARDL